MDSIVTEQEHCIYTRLENGVHEFVMLSSKRDAIDVYMAMYEPIYRQLPADGVMYSIVDQSQSGMPPITYLTSAVKRMIDNNPPRRKTCMAIIFSNNMMVALLETVRTLLTKPGYDDVRFFHVNNRDQAIAWLNEAISQ